MKGYGNASYRKKKYRIIRGDMIEAYKVITDKYDTEASTVQKLNLSTKEE